MKKFFAVSISLLAIFLVSISIQVSAKDIYNEELELSLTVPDSFLVISKDTDEDDYIFDYLGVSKDDLLAQFKRNNIYMNFVSQDNMEEIVVTMTPNDLNNFDIPDVFINKMAEAIEEECEKAGVSVTKQEIYYQEQTKFVKVYFENKSVSSHCLQYYTVVNNKALNFTMHSYEGELTQRQENTLKSIVDSIKFDSLENEEFADSEPFLYCDKNADVEFTVPAGWTEKRMSEKKLWVDAEFVNEKNSVVFMLFGAVDVWENMPAGEKIGITRKDVDKSFFSTDDIVDMFDFDEFKLKINRVYEKYYNGFHYYMTETSSQVNVMGVTLDTVGICAMHIQNGWMYMFYSYGIEDNPLTDDFEKMLRSVSYGLEKDAVTSSQGNEVSTFGKDENSISAVNTDDLNNSKTVWLWAGFFVFLILLTIIVIAMRKSSSKSHEEPPKNNNVPPYESEGLQGSSIECGGRIYCKYCGTEFRSGGNFCHKCGARK